MNKKYELTDETKQIGNTTLYRIKALRDFSDVKAGYLGGFVESEKNLSHDGDCWVNGIACVYESGCVLDNAQVYGHSKVYGNAVVRHDAKVYGWAQVYDYAQIECKASVSFRASVSDNVFVYDNAQVMGSAEIGGQARVRGSAIVTGTSQLGGSVDVRGTAIIESTKSWLINGVFDAGVVDQLNHQKTELNKMKLDREDDGFQLVSDTPALGCDHVEMSFPMQLKEKGMTHWYCCKKCGEAVREFDVDN